MRSPLKTLRRCCNLIAIVFLFAHFSIARADTPRPVPAIQRVVIISIDGCRPDLLLRANAPVIRGLMQRGSYSFWACTIAEAITLPSHTSMLTGAVAARHQILWNNDLPDGKAIYPQVPTLFQLAKKSGYSTAMVAGKSKFISLAVPGSLDWQSIAKASTQDDGKVADAAVEVIHAHKPQVLFVHLPEVDNIGHATGWATPEQIAGIERADACIGRILQAIDEEKLTGETAVIVTADHGGAGRSHGPDDPRSRHIPWIIAGPGIRQNLDLTTYRDLVIDTEDTFFTACYLLNIPVETADLNGKPITQVVDRKELLQGK